jgi:aubergine-like protein
MAFKTVSEKLEKKCASGLAYFAVGKKIDQKYSNQGQNPSPLTIIGQSASQYPFDFKMIGQCVERGTATPTLWVCLHNTTTLSENDIYSFVAILCMNYANFRGPVKVPCVMQYAKKLSMRVGDHLLRNPSEKLSLTLYYL